MTIRIAHLSDVHFGGEDAGAVEAAVEAVADFDPTLTAVTGDLTLNGLPREFRAAAQWLHRLPCPKILTPGNHDTPYWNLIQRTLNPFDRYREFIGDPQCAAFDAPGVAVRTVNSARGGQMRLDWSKGALSIEQLRRIEWHPASNISLKVFGCHHPLIDIVGAPVTGGVHCGAQAAEILATAGVELILTGHVHIPFVLPMGHHQGCYAVGAGTLSVRTRGGAPASFSVIVIEPASFEITVMEWTGERFQPGQCWTLPRRGAPMLELDQAAMAKPAGHF